jgi:hypothetical protein
MRRTEMLQEIRRMRFEEVYFGWSEDRLTQEEATILGVRNRVFRRHINRYEDLGIEGLSDKQLKQSSLRRAPVRWGYIAEHCSILLGRNGACMKAENLNIYERNQERKRPSK